MSDDLDHDEGDLSSSEKLYRTLIANCTSDHLSPVVRMYRFTSGFVTSESVFDADGDASDIALVDVKWEQIATHEK